MRVTKLCNICGIALTLEIPDRLAELDMTWSETMESNRRRARLPREKAVSMADLFKTGIAPAVCHDACIDKRDRKWLADEKARKIVERAQEWAGICPPLYQDTDPEKIPDRLAFKRALAWTWGASGLVLHGPTGFGKTRIAYLLALREFDKQRMVAAFSHIEFSAKVIKLMDGRHSLDKWAELLGRLDLVFIDDFGKSRFTDYADRGKHSEEVLFDLFEKRCANRLPTIFTCNMVRKDLLASMSADRAEPFLRRMKEFCQFIVVDGGAGHDPEPNPTPIAS